MTGAGLVVDGGLTAQRWAQAVELRSSRAPLNPKVEVSDVDGWACSLVSCHRNSLIENRIVGNGRPDSDDKV